MPSFTFQPGFVPYIRDGIKRHTIRTTLRCKPGDSMNLLTQKCHHIATRPCILVDNVTVSLEGPRKVDRWSLPQRRATGDVEGVAPRFVARVEWDAAEICGGC